MKSKASSIIFFGFCFLVYLACFWAWTGTVAPYAATVPGELVGPFFGCNYPTNIDHAHFKALFHFLDGAPKDLWSFSVVLRRVLQPILSYPFMKLMGFEYGGIAFNFIAGFAGSVLFSIALKKKFGALAQRLSLLLLSSYPGLFYWSGLPYSYGICVPVFLLSLLVLIRLSESIKVSGVVWKWSLALGILNLGYDCFPYMIPATFLVCWRGKALKRLIPAVALQVLPLFFVIMFFRLGFNIKPGNSNTGMYEQILGSYGMIWAYKAEWFQFVLSAPKVFFRNFLDSNFLFLPLLFLAVLVWSGVGGGWRTLYQKHEPAVFMLVSILAVWLFNNLAPPYSGWQMRGEWVARFYQPLLAPLLWILAAEISGVWNSLVASGRYLSRGFLGGAVVLCMLGNLWIIWGIWLGSQFSSDQVYRFYAHLPNFSSFNGREVKAGRMPDEGTSPYLSNLKAWGVRPLGVCQK